MAGGMPACRGSKANLSCARLNTSNETAPPVFNLNKTLIKTILAAFEFGRTQPYQIGDHHNVQHDAFSCQL